MGFYSSATLIKDAQRHQVRVLPVSMVHSDWLCTVESDQTIRLGFCLTQGIQKTAVAKMIEERDRRPFADLLDFRTRTHFARDELRVLAKAGALNPLTTHRRQALWSVEEEFYQDELFTPDSETIAPLPPMEPIERLTSDFETMKLTVGPHPLGYLRSQLPNDIWRSIDLPQAPNGSQIRIGGQVICRQRPGTAKGFVFISLEDETGISNSIVTPQLFEKYRLVITQESFLVIEGILQVHAGVIHVRAKTIERLPALALDISDSHDFH
jgi:error-prone DNA polymerase